MLLSTTVIVMAVSDKPSISHWRDPDDGAVRRDCRRPGRVAVDPALISLLRGTAPIIGSVSTTPPPNRSPAQASLDFGTEMIKPIQLDELDDGGNPGRGVSLAIILCAMAWPVAFVIACWLS